MALTKAQRRKHIHNSLRQSQIDFLQPAEIGKLEAGGTYTVFANKSRNIVYARLIKDNNRLIEAHCIKLDPKARMGVWIKETTDGFEVDGLRPKNAADQYGQGAPGLNTPTKPGEFWNNAIGGRNFKPGLVRLAQEDTLVVHIEAFRTWWNGAEYTWPGGTYDLSGDLPATSNYWHWARLAVNPVTNVVNAVTGTEYANKNLLTEDELDTLDMDGLIPLDAIKLQNGSTTIQSADDFFFARAMILAGNDYYSNITTTNPGTGDDTDDGYAVGSRWYNTSLDLEFVCLDATASAAVWKCTTITKSTADVSNPPTDAELDSEFGVPSGWPLDALIVLDDNGGETNTYLIWSTGTSWFYVAGTVAT